MYTVLSIAGPKSKDLMEEMSGSDMAMHPFTYRSTNNYVEEKILKLTEKPGRKKWEGFPRH